MAYTWESGSLTTGAGTATMQSGLQPNCMMLGWHVQHQVQGIHKPGCTSGPSLGTPVLQSHSDATPCPRMTSRVFRGEDFLFLERQHICAI